MGEFLQNNWFWIAVLVFLVWMHASGMGCGGHGGTVTRTRKRSVKRVVGTSIEE